MEYYFGQDCGKYEIIVDLSQIGPLTVSIQDLGTNQFGKSYPNKMLMGSTRLEDIGQYQVSMEIYQNSDEGYLTSDGLPATMSSFSYPMTITVHPCQVSDYTVSNFDTNFSYTIGSGPKTFGGIQEYDQADCGYPETSRSG
jgi:hypothetical protein